MKIFLLYKINLYYLEYKDICSYTKLFQDLSTGVAELKGSPFSLHYKCCFLNQVYRVDDEDDLKEAFEFMSSRPFFYVSDVNKLPETFEFPAFPIFTKPISILDVSHPSSKESILKNKPQKKKSSNRKSELSEVECVFCKRKDDGLEGEGQLMLVRVQNGPQYAHRMCALSTPQIYFDEKKGKISGVSKVLLSSQFQNLKCSYGACRKSGAMLICPIEGCQDGHKQATTYHFTCAFQAKCGLGSNFQFYCSEHVNHPIAIKNHVLVPATIDEWTQHYDYEENSQVYKCIICRKYDDADKLIECDGCGSKAENTFCGFHLKCVNLSQVPKEKWFCQSCKAKNIIKDAKKMNNVQSNNQTNCFLLSPTSFIYKENIYNLDRKSVV